jgi:hypothetical protein
MERLAKQFIRITQNAPPKKKKRWMVLVKKIPVANTTDVASTVLAVEDYVKTNIQHQ